MTITSEWKLHTRDFTDKRDGESIGQAAELLRQGATVAFPTETVYGLGADARSTAAVEQIFQAKGRPSDNPLIVHISDISQLQELVLPYGEITERLIQRFWPGPLTIVLPVKPGAVSLRVTAGLDTVAVRMPANETALRLIAEAGCPVAAPSANRSGRPSPTTAAHVREDLYGLIAGIVDGGPAGVGLESTVIEIAGPDTVRILRPGGVTQEQLAEVCGTVLVDRDGSLPDPGSTLTTTLAPRSPGMKYTHYAPRGEMLLVAGGSEAVSVYIQAEVDKAKLAGRRTGVLAFAETAHYYQADVVLACGSLLQLETAAQQLYAMLREFDASAVELIWAEVPRADGIGLALLNRLVKAAGNRIAYV